MCTYTAHTCIASEVESVAAVALTAVELAVVGVASVAAEAEAGAPIRGN